VLTALVAGFVSARIGLAARQTAPAPLTPKASPAVQKLLDEAAKLAPKDQAAVLLRAIDIAHVAHDLAGEAKALTALGYDYVNLSQLDRALDIFKRVLPLRIAGGDDLGHAESLYSLGYVSETLARPAQALDYISQALPFYRKVQDRVGEANSLKGLGVLYRELAQYSRALESYKQSLSIWRELGKDSEQASTLLGMGSVYYSLAQFENALECFEAALPIEHRSGNRIEEAGTLCGMGLVYEKLLRYSDALIWYQKALPVSREAKYPLFEANILNDMGAVYRHLAQPLKALELYDRCLPIYQRLGNLSGEAGAWGNIGLIRRDLRQYAAALDAQNKAIPMARVVKDRAFEANAFDEAASLLRLMGKGQLAIAFGKKAMRLNQAIRSGSSRLGSGDSRSLAEKFATSCRNLAAWLAEEGRAPEAVSAISAMQEDAGAANQLPRTNLEQDWMSGYDRQVSQVAGLEQTIAETKSQINLGLARSDKLKQLESECAQAESAALHHLLGLVSQSDPLSRSANRIAETRTSKELLATLAALPSGAAAVYEIANGDDLHLIVARSTGLTVKNVRAEDCDKDVERYVRVLQRPDLDPNKLGGKLYDVLIRPIESLLDPHGVTMWCLTGSLRTVPIAALWDGTQYAFEKFPSCEFSPAFAKELAGQPSRNAGAIVAGVTRAASLPDPVTGTSVDCAALPGVDEEVRGVSAALGVTPMFDGDFTAGLTLLALKRKPGIVHLASHFVYVPGNDRRSFLLTGGNGAWSVEKIKDLPDDTLRGVDLVTLSACATAEGKSAAGDEKESFANWMLRKGAGAVLSTLWAVNDLSTSVLMAEFYRLRVAHSDWTKVQTLSAVQADAVEGKLKGTTRVATRRSEFVGHGKQSVDAPPWPKDRPAFSHPYYWAPFVLTGNWK
jgi:CHAT domain-containing protein